ncbi:MAG TPA: hypothetical protein PKA05_22125, partial [Roseiflexaceae bacterium]|nr:hypothetical protein [Roseiflexaceae bacterium]
MPYGRPNVVAPDDPADPGSGKAGGDSTMPYGRPNVVAPDDPADPGSGKAGGDSTMPYGRPNVVAPDDPADPGAGSRTMQALIFTRWKENHQDTEGTIAEHNETSCSLCLCGAYPMHPFIWHDERRAHIRAELDARIAKLYGLSRDELRYILDPADVYGPDFPGETFRVLKEKETRLYGEYRTRRLVLAAWDAAVE